MARSVPFQRTIEEFTKPLPLIVKVKAGSPVNTDAGLIVVRAGRGLPTVNANAEEVPPPGVGVKTKIDNVPAFAKSDAVNVTPNCDDDVKVVTRSVLFIRTIEFDRKRLPVKIIVVSALPTCAEV